MHNIIILLHVYQMMCGGRFLLRTCTSYSGLAFKSPARMSSSHSKPTFPKPQRGALEDRRDCTKIVPNLEVALIQTLFGAPVSSIVTTNLTSH